MPADRFFLGKPLQEPLVLEGEELHHLQVMRIRVGETIELVNGQGELAHVKVVRVDKKRAQLELISHQKVAPFKEQLILAQGLPRLSALEWIIEKGTELGVTKFWLFPADRSEKTDLSSTQLRRLETIQLSALKQCGRLFLPQIVMKPPLSEWSPIKGSLFYGALHKAPKLTAPFSDTTLFFIGPEKGLSPTEIEKLHILNVKPISLHENTLRTETAAIAALSQFYSTK